ncbi:MAG TPA: hypothetical protein VFY32_06840 [Solirubrobacteraceae bacterium]|nr:hypothetical protein [Solirubrobacteraceae bacterium]
MTGPRLLLLAVLGALALPSSSPAADLVIKVRSKHVSALGAFKTNGSHGTLRNAVRAWGRPSTRNSAGGGFCHVNWSSVGVKAVFVSGCGDSSRMQRATLHSKRWTTERGLHVGDPTAKVKQLYPGAEFTVSYFWLYKAYDSFVQGDAPIVEAQMKGGAVNLIQVQVNAPR